MGCLRIDLASFPVILNSFADFRNISHAETKHIAELSLHFVRGLIETRGFTDPLDAVEFRVSDAIYYKYYARY